jgi:hypothetical protein
VGTRRPAAPDVQFVYYDFPGAISVSTWNGIYARHTTVCGRGLIPRRNVSIGSTISSLLFVQFTGDFDRQFQSLTG